jgi:hypothetical protein
MIQKTNAAYLELHTYTSRYKNSQSFVNTSQDVETIIQIVPNFVHSVASDESYGSCDSLPCTRCKWILAWVAVCEIVCGMHVAQLLQTLTSLTAYHTNSPVVG